MKSPTLIGIAAAGAVLLLLKQSTGSTADSGDETVPTACDDVSNFIGWTS